MRLPSLTPYVLAALAGLSVYFIMEPMLEKPEALRPSASADKKELGHKRPDFELADYNGNPVAVSQYDGQALLINFWASWCPPCREEIPDFIDVYDIYHEEGFEIIGIAIDEREEAEAFIRKIPGLDYPQLIGFDDAIEVARQFGNVSGGLPYSVLIDKQGIVRKLHQGRLHKEELIDAIEAMLATRLN